MSAEPENVSKEPESEEDTLRAISALVGMVLGLLIGVPISIVLGLLGKPGEGFPPYDFIANLGDGFTFFSFSILLGCIIAFSTSVCLWRRKGRTNFGHAFLSAVTLLFSWAFIGCVMTFVLGPFNAFLLGYMDQFEVFMYGALVFLPFAISLIYILFPDRRSFMRYRIHLALTRKFWHGVWRNRRNRRRMLLLLMGLALIMAIDVWRIFLR